MHVFITHIVYVLNASLGNRAIVQAENRSRGTEQGSQTRSHKIRATRKHESDCIIILFKLHVIHMSAVLIGRIVQWSSCIQLSLPTERAVRILKTMTKSGLVLYGLSFGKISVAATHARVCTACGVLLTQSASQCQMKKKRKISLVFPSCRGKRRRSVQLSKVKFNTLNGTSYICIWIDEIPIQEVRIRRFQQYF
uniref:Secreted protein n=1 Tax=Trichogramma kaykai TaxID=54128 RepID=A0ABD2X0N3_9HYME